MRNRNLEGHTPNLRSKSPRPSVFVFTDKAGLCGDTSFAWQPDSATRYEVECPPGWGVIPCADNGIKLRGPDCQELGSYECLEMAERGAGGFRVVGRERPWWVIEAEVEEVADVPRRNPKLPKGTCPIGLGPSPHAMLTDPEILDWFFRARRHLLASGHLVTKNAIVAWMASVIDDPDLLPEYQEILRRHAPEDDPKRRHLEN